jgi:hypothetical protein
MIGLLMMAALQSTDSPRLPTEEEIIVTARRMRQVRVETRVDHRTGAASCWVTTSSGDPRIDWETCEITKACAALGPANKQLVRQCLVAKDEAFLKSYVPAPESTQHASH